MRVGIPVETSWLVSVVFIKNGPPAGKSSETIHQTGPRGQSETGTTVSRGLDPRDPIG
jgi:hypothetical protein